MIFVTQHPAQLHGEEPTKYYITASPITIAPFQDGSRVVTAPGCWEDVAEAPQVVAELCRQYHDNQTAWLARCIGDVMEGIVIHAGR